MPDSMLAGFHYAIIGGDERQRELYWLMEENGYKVRTYGLETGRDSDLKETITQSEVVLFPILMADAEGNIPLYTKSKKITADEAVGMLPENAFIICGKANSRLKKRAERREVKLIDILDDEVFAIENAIPSVEGAIACAIIHSSITIHNSRCMVIGYGRIGRLLACQLRQMGACTYVAARRLESRAWAEAEGHRAYDTADMETMFSECDFIFNTIPVRLLGMEALRKINKNCLLVELASRPFIFDPVEAEEVGVKYRIELGLPGRYAPKTAAGIILDTVERLIRQNMEVI